MVSRDLRSEARNMIFGTLQLSNDIYRNNADSDFCATGGEIIYCFDSNVFRLFYETTRWQSAISSYERHSINSKRYRGSQWKSIETQAAIIASEYLLSENLPGSKNTNIYLSPWHRKELALSLDAVIRDLRSPKRIADVRNSIEREIKLKMDFLKGVSFSQSKQLLKDLDTLERHSFSKEQIRRYNSTRLAADVLMNCPVTETFDQVHRLLSPPLCNRIRSLDTIFRPSEDDIISLREDSIQWFWRIEAEIKRREYRNVFDNRNEQSKWNDARTLAYIRWASNLRMMERRKILLVTSDDLIFDCYRRWWASLPDKTTESEEPFLLRRTFQYAPIFNLTDTRNDLHRSEVVRQDMQGLFNRIRESVELQLLPFNLSFLGGEYKRDSDSSVLRSREYLTMRASDSRYTEDGVLDYFISRMKDEWFHDQRSSIQDVSRIWKDIHRISIGFFHDKITKRLEDDRFIFGISEDEAVSAGAGDKILAFFRKSFDTLASRTRAAWVPAAVDFLLNPMENIKGDVFDRVPRTVWFKLPDEQSALRRIIYWYSQPEDERREFLDAKVDHEPASIFVLACLLAIQKQDLLKAEEFAKYAATAAEEHGPFEIVWEIHFLTALIKRFRIGSSSSNFERVVDGSLELGLTAQGERHFMEALSLLDESIEYFEADNRALPELIRAHSERAALHLFRALTMMKYGNEDEEFRVTADLIEKDISDCFRLDGEIASEMSDDMLEVKRQFTHNAAAVAVLRFLANPLVPVQEMPWQRDVTSFLLGDKNHLKNNAALQAERLAYLILTGAVDPDQMTMLEEAISEGFNSPLAVDRRLVRLLHTGTSAIFRTANEIFLSEFGLELTDNLQGPARH